MQKEVHILDYLKAIWKKRVTCVGIVFVITFGAIGYSYLMPDVYSAQASIIPITSKSGGSGGIGAGLASAVSVLGGANGSTNQLVLFLKSRVLRERVVKALDLVSVSVPDVKGGMLSQEQALAQAADSLQGMVHIANDRIYTENIIISVEHGNPEMAVTIVRQYLVELQNFISDSTLTSAKRYRLYLDHQILKNKREMLEVSKYLANFYREYPVSEVRAKVDVPLETDVEGELHSFKNYQELKDNFDALRKQDNSGNNKKELLYVRDVPHQVFYKYLANQKLIAEQNATMLAQAYETAKMEEVKQEPSFQILEDPIVPRYRIAPQRKQIASRALTASIVIAIFYVLWSEFKSDFRRRIFKDSAQEDQKVADVSDYRLGTI